MDNSPHGQLTPWTTRPMDNSPHGQLAPVLMAKIEGLYHITLLTHFAASLFSIHWFALHYYADQANIA
jgi:hypothetical protein